MKPPHIKRTVVFDFQGHKVMLHVLAYRKIDDEFLQSCVADWMRSRGRKKMTCDMEVTLPTLLGAGDSI